MRTLIEIKEDINKLADELKYSMQLPEEADKLNEVVGSLDTIIKFIDKLKRWLK